MGKIQVMSDALASQVAAGEVVERPASVAKELIENSLDAGARRVEVLAERGGAALLRVIDDGAGMSREDALLSVERHATSKLRSKEDLARVSTFGFRGEALPSIASVSRFRLATRPHDAVAGTEIYIEGGEVKEVRDSGEAPGTQIEVRSLFYNIPARRKFLRAEATEFGHLEAAVRVAALARPDVAFSLRHGTRNVFQVGAARGRLERIADLAGAEVAENLLELEITEGEQGLAVDGWVGRPGFTRPNRSLQYLFLNGRPIDPGPAAFGLREAYAGLLERGQHPPVFLFITAEPATIDVNVHPAKREVRFHHPRALQALVAGAVREALRETAHPPALEERPPTAATTVTVPVPATQPTLPISEPAAPPAAVDVDPPPPAEPSAPLAGTAPEFRTLGTLGERYLVLESAEGLVLLHRRAAHERVLFEQALAAAKEGGVASQGLLQPATLRLGAEEYGVAIANIETLDQLGVGLEPFGSNTLKIDRLPAFCADIDPIVFVSDLIADLRESGANAGRRAGERDLAAAVSHRAARAGEAGHRDELDSLVASLMKCEMPYCDPRGRPTLIQFSHQELGRKFGVR